MRARTASAVASALAPGASWMPMPAAGRPSYFVSTKYVSAPRPIRATSRSRTREPSVSTLSRMSPNCSGVRSRVASVIVAVRRWPGVAGVPPSWPPATCTFCAWIAAVTSTGVNWKP